MSKERIIEKLNNSTDIPESDDQMTLEKYSSSKSSRKIEDFSLREKIEYAFLKSLPVLCGYIFLGIAWGIVLEEAGFNFVWALFISICVFAGSMQFVLVPLLVASAPLTTVAVTTFFVNSRHMFYGLSFIESFRKMKQYLYMIFSLSDETFSVLCGCKTEDPEEIHRDQWFLIALFDQSYWVIGSLIGALLGQVLPFDMTGIDFAMTALFVVILFEQVLEAPKSAGLAGLVGLIAAVGSLLIFGGGHFLLPSLIVTVLIVATTVIFISRNGSEQDDKILDMTSATDTEISDGRSDLTPAADADTLDDVLDSANHDNSILDGTDCTNENSNFDVDEEKGGDCNA